MNEILGYASAFAVGLILGLIGAGGAILTVPIFVYLLKVKPVLATVYSLFIVGATSLTGSVSYFRKGLINFSTSLAFAIPSVLSIFFTRIILLPAIPEILFKTEYFSFTKDHAILLFFAVIMLLSSYSMIFRKIDTDGTDKTMRVPDYAKLFLYGIFTGLLSGFVGGGGGFIIVPALVFMAKIPVKSAIGTSLLIIAANTLTGFIGDLTQNYLIDWKMLLIFLSVAIAGILTGSYLTKFISGDNLKKSFGVFVFVMGIYIIIREIVSLN